MKINYPSLCKTNSSKLIFCFELMEELRLWHNEQCQGKGKDFAIKFRRGLFKRRERIITEEIGIQRGSIIKDSYWNPDIKTGVSVRALNSANHGSVMASLLEQDNKQAIAKSSDEERDFVIVEKTRVRVEARDAKYWNAKLEDIR